MTVKHLHFFGCSFTAGDELADSVWFPWKKDIADRHQYHKKRNEFFQSQSPSIYSNYVEDNKKLAYPNLVNADNILVYNHAKNGMAMDEIIYRIFELIEANDKPIHGIYLQPPPYPREMFMLEDSTEITSIHITNFDTSHCGFRNYVREKIMSHSIGNFVLNDLLYLSLLNGYIKSKNIKLFLLDIQETLKRRLGEQYDFSLFKSYIDKNCEIVDLESTINDLYHCNYVELAGHWNARAHEILAEKISDHVRQNF